MRRLAKLKRLANPLTGDAFCKKYCGRIDAEIRKDCREHECCTEYEMSNDDVTVSLDDLRWLLALAEGLRPRPEE